MAERTPGGYQKTFRPEHRAPELTPGERARVELMRDIFETSYKTLHAEQADGRETNASLLSSAMDVIRTNSKHPLSVGKNLQNMDVWARERFGFSGGTPLGLRLARIGANAAVGSAAFGVDLIDSEVGKKAINRRIYTLPGPVGNAARKARFQGIKYSGAVGGALEFISDQFIDQGVDWGVQKITKDSRVHYASPLARTIYRVTSKIPVAREYLNASTIEAALRIGYNVPIYGAPVEAVYRALNDRLRNRGRSTEFAQGLAESMLSGQMEYQKKTKFAAEKWQREHDYLAKRDAAIESANRRDDRIRALEERINILEGTNGNKAKSEPA